MNLKDEKCICEFGSYIDNEIKACLSCAEEITNCLDCDNKNHCL